MSRIRPVTATPTPQR